MSKWPWRCRTAPSLGGGFAGTPESAWGTKPYDPETDLDKPTVFFGLYGLPDFYTLWRHRGEKHILWAGSDIRHFRGGYYLDKEGQYLLKTHGLGQWINQYCTSWVENEVEQASLGQFTGIDEKKIRVVPSFLGDTNAYSPSFTPGNKVYTSVSGNDFVLYGWDFIEEVAGKVPELEFHLYGNSLPWKTRHKNVIVHGRVPMRQMDRETAEMQVCLRAVAMEGCSELIVKAALRQHYIISMIPYAENLLGEYINTFDNESRLRIVLRVLLLGGLPISRPNSPRVRQWFLKNLNQFPWNQYA